MDEEEVTYEDESLDLDDQGRFIWKGPDETYAATGRYRFHQSLDYGIRYAIIEPGGLILMYQADFDDEPQPEVGLERLVKHLNNEADGS